MTAYFYDKNTKRTAHYTVDLVDELPAVEQRPSQEDITHDVNYFGHLEYIDKVTEISADNLPSVDDGYYSVFEIEVHEFDLDDSIKEEVTFRYAVVFQPYTSEE